MKEMLLCHVRNPCNMCWCNESLRWVDDKLMNFQGYNNPTIIQLSKKANTLVDLVFQMEGSHVIASQRYSDFCMVNLTSLLD